MTHSPATLRAVFLDIGDTVMRPNPSWEAVYAVAFREFDVEVEIGELHAALRRAYHHGGWGIDDAGFEPSEESSFRRTVEIDIDAREIGSQSFNSGEGARQVVASAPIVRLTGLVKGTRPPVGVPAAL